MANISTYLADQLLDHSFGEGSYTEPTVYVALWTTNPTMPAGTGGTEVSSSGTAYVREALAGLMAAAASGSITTNANITWPTATASWGTVTGVGLFDASSGGNLLWSGALTLSKTVGSGDTFQIPTGDLTGTIS